MGTATLDIVDISAIYDRIYDIADRLFKKYNPCNIHKKDNKTICNDGNKASNALCCFECSPFCGINSVHHWDNGCTVKCLACKLFMCGTIQEQYPILADKLLKLQRIAYKYKLGKSVSTFWYTKEDWLKHIRE